MCNIKVNLERNGPQSIGNDLRRIEWRAHQRKSHLHRRVMFIKSNDHDWYVCASSLNAIDMYVCVYGRHINDKSFAI